jgi:uncharacterized protein
MITVSPSKAAAAAFAFLFAFFSASLEAQSSKAAVLPELTQPVNDFAGVIDQQNAAAIDRMIRQLQMASGDVVIVATVPTIEPYGDIREYANKLFENHGRGIGQKGKNNGLLILLSLKERKVWVEVGYDLEQWVTDGFSGETSRQYMVPRFRNGNYSEGLRVGTERIISRIAQGRNVSLQDVRPPREPGVSVGPFIIVLIIVAFMILSRIGRGPRGGIRRWGAPGWSGWSSGVGSFGGGWSGGGGFGGGFGGFGGGSSGGGGGGGSW